MNDHVQHPKMCDALESYCRRTWLRLFFVSRQWPGNMASVAALSSDAHSLHGLGQVLSSLKASVCSSVSEYSNTYLTTGSLEMPK